VIKNAFKIKDVFSLFKNFNHLIMTVITVSILNRYGNILEKLEFTVLTNSNFRRVSLSDP